VAPARVGVKASGGIKTLEQVRELISAGADLVGTSRAVQIMREMEGLPRAGNAKSNY
jgi:deoxyribose-phosphate aldolase